jgi:hypothetical protein
MQKLKDECKQQAEIKQLLGNNKKQEMILFLVFFFPFSGHGISTMSISIP